MKNYSGKFLLLRRQSKTYPYILIRQIDPVETYPEAERIGKPMTYATACLVMDTLNREWWNLTFPHTLEERRQTK